MKNRAFTLIELLVVVLIIGILAAIALPQYQKAVYKARAMEALILTKALTEAEEVYYLANGEYTTDVGELDVQISSELVTTWGEGAKFDNKYSYTCGRGTECIASINNNNMPSFQFNFRNTGDVDGGKFYCTLGSGTEKTDMAKAICRSLGGVVDTTRTQSWAIDKYFILN